MMSIINKKVAAALLLLVLGGCAAQSANFSWYHPQGGEYLFAYDREECANLVQSQGLSLGTDIKGPFFQCMHRRGYYLVNDTGIVQAPGEIVAFESPQVTQQ
jgi:hypothetical protein